MDLYEYKIMLVDDEPELRRMVGEFLAAAGFCHVVYAESVNRAREVFDRERPHLVLLDVMLPDGDGFTLLKELHRASEVPVIFLSAKDEDKDRLKGLGLGADDYITKPFLPRELILRVQAVLKRVYRVKDAGGGHRVIDLGNCRVDLGSGTVSWNMKDDGPDSGNVMAGEGACHDDCGIGRVQKRAQTTLTAKEYAIMEKLSANRGQIVTIDALCESVWREENFGYENTLVVHIRRLREKIEENPSKPQHLITVRGLGYKLV